MTRILLRLANAPILILLITLAVAVESSLFNLWPLNYLQPDLLLLTVIWFGFTRGFTEGGILTLVASNIGEVHSAAPAGLFLISYMLVYLGVRLLVKVFVVPNLSALLLLTLAASVTWRLSSMAILHLLGMSWGQGRHMMLMLFPGAVIDAAFGYFVFRALERIDWSTYKSTRAARALRDELSEDVGPELHLGIGKV